MYIVVQTAYTTMTLNIEITLAIIVIKVSQYIFRGNNSAIFVVASLLITSQHFKERVCSLMSKLFLWSVDLILEVFCLSGKQTEVMKQVACCKNGRQTWR